MTHLEHSTHLEQQLTHLEHSKDLENVVSLRKYFTSFIECKQRSIIYILKLKFSISSS